jgi:hypothetical protein
MPGTKKAVASEVSSVEARAGSSAGESPVRRRASADWESAVMRRLAPRVAELEEQAEKQGNVEELYGWESVGLRHLSNRLALKG